MKNCLFTEEINQYHERIVHGDTGVELLQIMKNDHGYWTVCDTTIEQFKNLKFMFKIDMLNRLHRLIF